MKNYIRIKARSITFIALFALLNVTNVLHSKSQISTHANLVLLTTGGGVFPDYGLFISQYLRDIYIDIEVKVREWSVFYGKELKATNFDLSIIDMKFNQFDPHPSIFYSLKSSMNYFSLDDEIPYADVSEDWMNLIYKTDSESNRKHFYNSWQQVMMNNIIPCLPLFYKKNYISVWSNLQGYDIKWSIANNMPYIFFNGTHEGQDDTNEFVIRDNNFLTLNPLRIQEDSSRRIASFLFEPLIQISPDNEILTTGLIYDWDEIYDCHYRFWVRDNIFWNPSFNITGRTNESLPLDITKTPLMMGLKGETSDGTNQKITAKDIVFTLLTYATNTTSRYSEQYKWIKDIYLDPVNDLIFNLVVDVDPTTEELDSYDYEYLNFLFRMNIPCLPEFFLNSTDETIVYTTANIPTKGLCNITKTAQWEAFIESAFGHGKYMIDYRRNNDITELQRNPNWHGIGPKEGKNQTLDIERVIIKVIPDEESSLGAFKIGIIDLEDVTLFPQERKQMQADPRFEVQSRYSSEMSCLIFNLNRPFIGGQDNFVYLEDKEKEEYTRGIAVRKAICYAIDREEMNTVLHEGEFSISHSPLIPYFSIYLYDEIIKYVRDIDMAIEWLEAAGYSMEIHHPPDLFPGLIFLVYFAFIIGVCFAVPSALYYIFIFFKKILHSQRKLRETNQSKI